QFGASQSDPDLIIVAVRVFALALIVPQVMSCGECIFDGDFEHDPPSSPPTVGPSCTCEFSILPRKKGEQSVAQAEETLYHAYIGCSFVIGQALDEDPAVLLFQDAVIEQNE